MEVGLRGKMNVYDDCALSENLLYRIMVQNNGNAGDKELEEVQLEDGIIVKGYWEDGLWRDEIAKWWNVEKGCYRWGIEVLKVAVAIPDVL